MAKRKATAKQFSLGVDYGTNSVRAVIVDISDGREIASSTFNYPSGVDGILLDDKDPNLARQNPTDYLVGFEKSVRAAVRAAAKKRGFAPNRIVCIGIDATGSTPIPVNRDGVALGATPRFQNNLDAQAWLWKDHTAHAEAAEITEKAANADADYLAKCGGTYSSEWYWSKMLHCRRVAPHVFKAAYSWVEQSDFIPAHLTGNTQPDKMARNACAAGHKAMYHEQWGGCPVENSSPRFRPIWPFIVTGIPRLPSPPITPPAISPPTSPRRPAFPPGFPLPSASLTPTPVPSAPVCAPARSSKSSGPVHAT